MRYKIFIRDIKTGTGIPGASIKAYNSVNDPAIAINLPIWSIDIPVNGLEFDPDAEGIDLNELFIRFEAPGFDSYGVDGNTIPQEAVIKLYRKPDLVKTLLIGAGLALVGGLVVLKGKKKVSGFFDDVPPMAKGALVLGGLGLGAYLLLNKKDDDKLLPNQADGELDKLGNQGIYPTFSTAQAEIYSSSLQNAFDDCGTDEDTVYSVFSQMQNNADVLLVVKTFGVRGYTGCFEGSLFTGWSANLSQAMTAELSRGELKRVNDILASRGITYKF